MRLDDWDDTRPTDMARPPIATAIPTCDDVNAAPCARDRSVPWTHTTPREPRLACREALTALSSIQTRTSRSTSVCRGERTWARRTMRASSFAPLSVRGRAGRLLVLPLALAPAILPRGGLWPDSCWWRSALASLIWDDARCWPAAPTVDPSLPATAVVTSGHTACLASALRGAGPRVFGLTLALDSWWGIVCWWPS